MDNWWTHINNIESHWNANFLKCHLGKCSPQIKSSVYLLLVIDHWWSRHVATVWDPHYFIHVSTLEKVQRHAASRAFADYSYQSSVTTMLNNLKWPPLTERRKYSRLNMFYHIVYGLAIFGLSLPEHYLPTFRYTRQ